MTTINEDGCVVFGPRSISCPKWPVRVIGMQGLWRYVGTYGEPGTFPIMVEVIGPYFPNNPERNGGRSRLISIDKIKYAGRSAKPVDVLHVQTTAVSNEAKRARRR
jgi:hypothetical protein